MCFAVEFGFVECCDFAVHLFEVFGHVVGECGVNAFFVADDEVFGFDGFVAGEFLVEDECVFGAFVEGVELCDALEDFE